MSNTPAAPTMTTEEAPNDHASFQSFFQSWIDRENRHVQELFAVSLRHEGCRTTPTPAADDENLHALVDRVAMHYRHYYKSKAIWARYQVVTLILPPRMSTMEGSLIWVGGFRPSLAFHILYSKSGAQLEARLEDLLMGVPTGDLGDLSVFQLESLDNLQKETAVAEDSISHTLTLVHGPMGQPSVEGLIHTVHEMLRNGVDERVLNALEARMLRVVQMADNLRRSTMTKVAAILTPLQLAHFLNSGIEMQLRNRQWRPMREDAGENGGGGQGDRVG